MHHGHSIETRIHAGRCCRASDPWCSRRSDRDSPILVDPPVEAAGAVDAQNAPTAPWKPQNGFHSYHKALLLLFFLIPDHLIPDQMVQSDPAGEGRLQPTRVRGVALYHGLLSVTEMEK